VEDGALEVVRAWLEAFNDGDREAFARRLRPDATFHQRATGQSDAGAADVADAYFAWRARFVGLHGRIVDGFGRGDRAALEVEWTGIHREPERPVRFTVCFLFTVAGAQIAEIVDHYDRLSFAEQLS
jgi:ketosteroid isomerase-like protein